MYPKRRREIQVVDSSTLQSKIFFIESSLKKLRVLQRISKEEFLANFQAIDSTKYNLQVIIEAIIDIATHIVARERWGV